MDRFLLTLRCSHIVISDEIEASTYCPKCALWVSVIAYSDYFDEEVSA